MRFLLVEDNGELAEAVSNRLALDGHAVDHADSLAEAEHCLAATSYDLILLDVMLPDGDGRDFLARSRAHLETPVIVLTARARVTDRVGALDQGADDYITKPFSPRELVARLKAVLRRAAPVDSESPIEIGGLLLDPVSHRVTIDGKPAEMGPTEYRLLQFFMTHQERAYTRSQLLDQVWGGNVYVEERTVDVHIRRLRKALGEAYENLVQTVRGTGYRFSSKS